MHDDPEQADWAMGHTALNLGAVLAIQWRLADAEQRFLEGLGVFRALAERNRARYSGDLAVALTSLGILRGQQNNRAAARLLLLEAAGILQELAAQNPERYRDDIARIDLLLRGL